MVVVLVVSNPKIVYELTDDDFSSVVLFNGSYFGILRR